MLSRRSLLLGTATVAAAAHAHAVPAPNGVDAARAIIRGVMAANPVVGLSVAVMRGEKLLWAEAFGKADIELDVPATPSHRFRLGSVSKIITATLAAELAASGTVDLDAGIVRYMPDLPTQHHATTLRQLLTHRGGIRHYAAKDESAAAPGPIDKRRYLSNAEILAVFIDDPLVAKPGETVSYSTFGYTLVSLVLESAAKQPFLDLVRSRVSEPLALESLAGDEPTRIVANRVSGYAAGDRARRNDPAFVGQWANAPQNNPAYKWAGGGLLSTPCDLARFGAAHLAPGKLSKAALEMLFTVQTEATDRSPPLGLGWRIDSDTAGRARWHHAGGQDGARASLVVYPREKLSIAFATNVTQTPGDVNGPSAQIADAFNRS
ncbi:MAG TPA: serine hydrolase domain-containing protein [Steroidobacteraceae bacterium]|nr:serine hydrolase domain-containing protein [Steroidobacteraceae bacterium]